MRRGREGSPEGSTGENVLRGQGESARRTGPVTAGNHFGTGVQESASAQVNGLFTNPSLTRWMFPRRDGIRSSREGQRGRSFEGALARGEVKAISGIGNRVLRILKSVDRVFDEIDKRTSGPVNPPQEEMRLPRPELGDLQRVGPNKPIGYLSRSVIEAGGHYRVEELIAEARASGLHAELRDGSCHPEESVYFADPVALLAVFDRHPGVFGSFTPTVAEYIGFLANTTVPGKTELFDTVTNTFADVTNPGRTDVENRQADRYVRYLTKQGVTARRQTEVDNYLNSLRRGREH